MTFAFLRMKSAGRAGDIEEGGAMGVDAEVSAAAGKAAPSVKAVPAVA
jgi:hypothetical protein